MGRGTGIVGDRSPATAAGCAHSPRLSPEPEWECPSCRIRRSLCHFDARLKERARRRGIKFRVPTYGRCTRVAASVKSPRSSAKPGPISGRSQPAFLPAVDPPCPPHGIQLCTSAYDAFGLWPLEPGEPPIFGCGVEDHLADP